ncbi:MAG TPA: phasin family protein [Xanthobacteraceae bacterium]
MADNGAKVRQDRSSTMANGMPPLNELSAQMQQGSEQMKEQARSAIDSYFGFLRQSVASMPSGGTDLGEKLKTCADKNIAATHEHLNKLSQVRDFEELMRLQTEFMESQMRQFSGNLQDLGEAFAKSAASVPLSPGSVNAFRK